MLDRWDDILITLIGILLLLPLLGVTALGDVSEGIIAWIIAIAVIVIGVLGIAETFK